MRYFVADGQQKRGPFSGQQLMDLNLRPETLIWREGLSAWIPVAELPELTPNFVRRPGNATYRNSLPMGWIVVGVLVVCTLFPVLGIVMLGAIGIPPDNGTSAATGQRTLAYWNEIRRITNDVSPQDNQATVISQLLKAADSIEATPTLDVDPDAVATALSIASLLRELANTGQRMNDPERLAEAFVRGLSGDVAGPLLESKQEQQALAAKYEQVRQQTLATRAILTSRYRVEFPPF